MILWLSITTCEKCKKINEKTILRGAETQAERDAEKRLVWPQYKEWKGMCVNGQHRCKHCGEVVRMRRRHVPDGCLAVGDCEVLSR